MNINGGLFFIICALVFPFVFGVVLMFPRMKIILKREYHSGLYKLGPAFLGTLVAQLPMSFLLPLLFSKSRNLIHRFFIIYRCSDGIFLVAIAYFLFGFFPSAVAFFSIYLTALCTAFVSSGYGFL